MKEIQSDNTSDIVIVTEKCKEKLISEIEHELLQSGCIKELSSKIRIS